MTIIIVPDEGCNFGCIYCFEPEEQRHNPNKITLDVDAIQTSLNEIWAGPYGGSDVCLHGGEPTLISRIDLEKLLKMMYNLSHKKEDGSIGIRGATSIVTNASRIDDYLISLFKQYNTYLSISVDGPPELNTLRGPNPNDEQETARYNEQLTETIIKLRENNIPVSIMCILHKKNAATQEQRDKMRDWFLWLKSIGITSGRTNPAYFYKGRRKELELSNNEVFKFYKMMYELNKNEGLHWNPLTEYISNIKGEKVSPCSLAQCDYFNSHTLSVHPDGTVGNCDRTFQDGMYIRSMDVSKSGRYQALQQTQCYECRYWPICGGGCPAEGFGDDWRNKTRFCEAIYSIYELIETDIRYFDPTIKLQINTSTSKVEPVVGGVHGDIAHGDSNHQDNLHGDGVHGDSVHSDAEHNNQNHGDLPHSDNTHADGVHGDLAHGDLAHGDIGHGDVVHGDNTHGDTGHGDSNHGDHSDWKKVIGVDEDE